MRQRILSESRRHLSIKSTLSRMFSLAFLALSAVNYQQVEKTKVDWIGRQSKKKALLRNEYAKTP